MYSHSHRYEAYDDIIGYYFYDVFLIFAFDKISRLHAYHHAAKFYATTAPHNI